MKRALSLICVAAMAVAAVSQTLEQCQQAAERNYPLIARYGLIEKTTELTVESIANVWLPQVTASAQATVQTDVPEFPDAMRNAYSQIGVDMKGLRRDQYRIGVDVQQLVYDGGASANRREVARQQGQLQAAQTTADVYQVRQRVNDMYFALLLVEEQIALNNDLQEQLATSEKKLQSMYRHGTAAECDYQNVRAERLNAVQQMTTLNSQRQALRRMLATFCDIEITSLTKPAATPVAATAVSRPELDAIDAQLRLIDERQKAVDIALKPQVGFFAQAFYGYPGFDMFHDMMSRNWTLNALVGARVTWNIGGLYNRKTDLAKLQLEREWAENSRDLFLFNNNLEQVQLNESIDRYNRMLQQDDEIIALRASIRHAAESKLAHGIIDANDLVREVTAENAARIQRSIHEIEMLKEIYNLKFVTNN